MKRKNANGFTLFELLAVLTVISISLAVVLGSYTSWATVHALDAATRTLEAGLLHARASAKAKNTYVLFYYGTEGGASNSVKEVSAYKPFVCTNDADRSYITEVLDDCSTMPCLGASEITAILNPDPGGQSVFSEQFNQLTSAQRLSGHITLGYVFEGDILNVKNDDFQPTEYGGIVIFGPDGGAWSWDDKSDHNIVVSTRKRFAVVRDGDRQIKPIKRILRVNLATGLVTTLRPEQLL